ncbi:MAG: hypothetical protein ACPGXK_00185 [Phycisphaerae bacterium]
MPNPNPSVLIGDRRPDISGSMMEFDLEADRRGFIGTRVLPVMEVGVDSSQYGIVPLEELLQNVDTERAPGAPYARSTTSFTKKVFLTKENGVESAVDAKNAKIYRNYLDAELVAARKCRDIVLRNQEKRVANLLFDATTWTGASLTTPVSNEWDDYANSTPIADVDAASRKVFDNTGLYANCLVINRNVFMNLRHCQEILDRIASAGAGNRTLPSDVTVQMLAEAFALDYVLVAGGAQNTANEAQAREISHIWSGEYASVCRIATETQNIEEPCVGRTFHYSEDGSEIGTIIETYWNEERRSTIVRARHDTDEKIHYVEMAHLLSNISQ